MRWLLACFVTILPLVALGAPATARVDLGATDLEEGLVNSQRMDPSDGENEVVSCGPAADVRECRKNWATEDPTLDVPPNTWPDGMFYFNVVDDAVKTAERIIIEVTVYDDPALQENTFLALNYTNKLATGPGDIPNTFFGHPVSHVLARTGAWVTVAWEINDAGFQSFQQGTSDFRVFVANSQRLCVDAAAVTVNESTLPADLTCRTVDRTTVALAWTNFGGYDTLVLKRDGAVIASLALDASAYEDLDVPEGQHPYAVIATAGAQSGGPSCTVTIFPDLTGQSVSCNLGESDVNQGMANSHTAPPDGGDGENEPSFCGPMGQEREGRSNWGIDDPTPDAGGTTLYPDFLFYFVVTEPSFKGQTEFALLVTVYDEPGLPAGTGLYLQYTNQLSTGPGDIANTFFPVDAPPVRFLGQTDAWVNLAWPIEGAGFRSFQQGDSDFRIGVTTESRVCIDMVQLLVGIPEDYPFDVTCVASGEDVTLTWAAFRLYPAIMVKRDGEVIATLGQNETSYVDRGVPPGNYTYEVTAFHDDREGGEDCDAVVGTAEPLFRRGDVNVDTSVNIADPIALLGHLFGGQSAPACRDAADGNDDGQLNIADAVAILGHLFGGTGPLPAPFPGCGVDPTTDPMTGCVYERCP